MAKSFDRSGVRKFVAKASACHGGIGSVSRQICSNITIDAVGNVWRVGGIVRSRCGARVARFEIKRKLAYILHPIAPSHVDCLKPPLLESQFNGTLSLFVRSLKNRSTQYHPVSIECNLTDSHAASVGVGRILRDRLDHSVLR